MSPPRILVVEDEIIIARDLEVRLCSMGYVVVGIASSGAEAIELAGRYLPDLILMDIVLKGEMDGIEAAAEIRKRNQLPIIYVTAYTDDKTLARAMVTEPFGYIVKPFLEREVKANIEMAFYKHRMETKLRRIERWFSQAFGENSEGVILADRQHRVSALNAVGETITAWPKELATGRKLGEVLRLTDKHGQPVDCEQLSEGPLVCLGDETWLLDRAGVSVPVDSMTSVVRDEENNLTGSISVFRDASGERHGALVSLVTSISLAVSESSTLRGMLQICADSVVQDLNGALVRIWTLDSRQEILELAASAGTLNDINGLHEQLRVGRGLVGTVAAEQRPHITNDLQGDLLVEDRAWVQEERLVALAAFPLMAEDQMLGVMAMFSRRFISPAALDTLEAVGQTIAVGMQRKRVEEQLRQSQKMEAVGLLAGGVAHDFNNLLTVITGYSEMLLDSNGLDEAARQGVAEILAAGEQAATLTRQLLAFSRKQVLAPVVLNLNAIVTNTDKMLRRVIGEDIQLTLTLDPLLGCILLDPGQAEQILVNLSVNARDAMHVGGRLTIETKNVALATLFSAGGIQTPCTQYVMLSVSDSGEGIAPEILPHIFEPFFTTKEAGKGTGLGLSTVYGMVKQAGGHVDVQSTVGQGTTFKVYLPSTGDVAVPERAKAGTVAARGTETVLVVEDEPAVRALIVRVLQDAGYNVLEAGNGFAALEICDAHDGPIHLLMSDVVMPDLAGPATVERWRAKRPQTKVIFMSGYTDDAVVRHGVLEAEIEFLQKPFSPVELAAKVRAVLDQKSRGTSQGG